MEKRFVLVVINPKSGGMPKEKAIQTIRERIKKSNYRVIVYQTTGKDDKQKVVELNEKYCPERILIGGGDGTVRMIIEALEEHVLARTYFGLLPLGSANGLAEDLDLPISLEECLHIALGNNFRAIDVIDINGMKSIHLSDLGLNAQLIKNYEKSEARGKLGYALQAIPTLRENRETFKANIKTTEKELETDARVILIANSRKYGTGVVVNPLGDISDDIFEIIVFKHLELALVIKILIGNLPLDDEAIKIIQTREASISMGRPTSFQIDGEYCHEVSQLQIKMTDAKVKFAVGE